MTGSRRTARGVWAAVAVFVAVLATAGAGVPAAAPAPVRRPASDDPITRVENGLLPAVAIRGQDVERNVHDRMRYHNVPGLSVAVINHQRIEWARGYGTTIAGGGLPVTPDTIFQAASVTKPVVAMAALVLVARGQLALDEDVNRRLRSWRVPVSRYTRRKKVTLRGIATHSAGLTSASGSHFAPGEPTPTIFQVLDGRPPARFGPVRVERVPGARFSYSNGGFSILQVLMTDVTGRAFPELLRELVLDPVGMSSSTFEQPLPAAHRARAAAGHDDLARPIGTESHLRPEMGPGGLWTTPSDLARFAIEVQRAAAGRSRRVLSADLARLMVTRQFQERSFGFAVSGKGEFLRVSHGGWNGGFKSQLVIYPARGQGAVLMNNGEHGGRRLNDEILRSLAREYGWPDLEPLARTLVTVDPARLARYAGQYGPVSVTLEEGALFIAPPGAPKDQLFATSANTFFVSDDVATFEFIGGTRRAATALRVRFSDGSVTRIPRRR